MIDILLITGMMTRCASRLSHSIIPALQGTMRAIHSEYTCVGRDRAECKGGGGGGLSVGASYVA